MSPFATRRGSAGPRAPGPPRCCFCQSAPARFALSRALRAGVAVASRLRPACRCPGAAGAAAGLHPLWPAAGSPGTLWRLRLPASSTSA